MTLLSAFTIELEKLNEIGYELFNSNVSMITGSQNGGGLLFSFQKEKMINKMRNFD